ncbi:MAG: IS1595 family transposase [Gammaproteobacteria bacterium]|nr:IS1595 family transposase [Gammaproteobacteria bacterium]
MENSRIPLRKWAVAIYLYSTSLTGISSMKLHRDLKITQKSAWFMLHRLRKAAGEGAGVRFNGPVEVDESYIGGKRKNMGNSKRAKLKDTGRGSVGKTAIVGMKDRETNEITAKVVDNANSGTLQGFVKDNADKDAKVYTDGATAYNCLPFDHEAVNHSVSEYVNGIEMNLWHIYANKRSVQDRQPLIRDGQYLGVPSQPGLQPESFWHH